MHYQYHPQFLYQKEADFLLDFLKTEIPWRQVKYFKPERGYVQTPRETWCAGFHNNLFYPVNGICPSPIPEKLIELKLLMEDFLNQKFNFMLFAKYRNGKDSIAYHSDDEMFLGRNPVIASLTLGESRPFCLKNKNSKEVQTWNLNHGDLFVMQEDCQKNYQHSVPKIDNFDHERYSITFRKALNEKGSYNYYTYNVGKTLEKSSNINYSSNNPWKNKGF